MEFWGVEVEVRQVVKVDKTELFGACIHLSQVALGEAKKNTASEPVVLYLKVGEQKLVLGTLTRDDIPQLSLDLVLDSEFELSHNSKNASVYFIGYRVEDAGGPLEGYEFSDSEDDLALMEQENGKLETKAEEAKVTESKKPMIGASAKQVKIADPKKDESDESDDESDDELMDADSDSEEESDSDESEDEDEETPAKKVDQGKKRSNESATKTPVPTKKAKNVTPEKTDGKKSVHTATPHPMKKGGKSPNSAAKNQTPNSAAKNQTPNSAAKNQTPSNKAFTSKIGQQQNKKAKHSGR